MERIEDEVARELRRFGPQAGMVELLAAWPLAVGTEIARNAWPARLGRDGTLYATASSSAWVFELTQMRATVLQRLRGELGMSAPRALAFVLGPLPVTTGEGAEPVRSRPLEPGADDVAEGVRIASVIADHELRSAVARAVSASLARRRDDRGV